MKPIRDNIDRGRFKRKPRYTVVLHNVREKLGLSLNTYVVIDSVHKLSTSDPDYPYCEMKKDEIADFLALSRATVFRALNEAEEAGLIERSDRGLRTTDRWINQVELYDLKAD